MTTDTKRRITLEMKERPYYHSKGMKGAGRKLAGEKKEGGDLYRHGVRIDVERPRLIAESYKETEGMPMVLRRAKALSHLLDNKTLYILPDERVVGNITAKPGCLIHYPELFWRWIDKEIERDMKNLVDDEERGELHKIHEYFQHTAVHGMERNLLPEDVKSYWRYDNHGTFLWVHGGRGGVANHQKIFRVGLNGLISQVEERLQEIQVDLYHTDIRGYLEQRRFLEAVLLVLQSAIRFGKRFAEKAREETEKATDATRKEELLKIADICEWIPGNPPRNFQEALQCYWFITLITRFLDMQSSGYGDRFDQLMYPFYKKDLVEGKITEEEAQELVEHLFLKMNEEGQLVPPAQEGAGGSRTVRNLTVSGITKDGVDATNDMTYITMNAAKEMGFIYPTVGIRLHNKSPQALLEHVTDVVRQRSGVFSLFNDEMMIPYLTNFGLPLEDARDYSSDGCMRWMIPGKALGLRVLGGMFVLPKCLEYALTQGMDKFSGKQWGLNTPDPTTFTSVNDLMSAFLKQVHFFLDKLVTINSIVDVLDEEYLPQPFLSAVVDGCIDRGQDVRIYKYFANTIIQTIGQITVANSITAIKKLVFDDKKVIMAEIVDGMSKNWEGNEDLRDLLLNTPKFGNDDEYVDNIARDVCKKVNMEVQSFKNIWGGSYMEDGTGAASYFRYSGLVGATPDGRKDRDPFNDGTVSPVAGTDMKGPTAVMNSVANIDHTATMTHLFNQKFLPELLQGDAKDAFIAYLRSFVELHIHHIQFNVIDKKILLDAQLHPESYSDLVVRVAGFAAYFVDLNKAVQDQIINRTDHNACC
ncbi:glycyl radical protein [Chloroflexota bacterium]